MATTPHTFDVTDLVVWVTGVESRLGHEVAALFASHGARVLGTDTGEVKVSFCERTASCRLTNEVDLLAALKVCEELGGLDALVNCGLPPLTADPLSVTEESWRIGFDEMLKGTFLCSQAAARAMIGRRRPGSIVNVGSIDADLYYPNTLIDSIASGGLNAMTRSMAVALAPHKVRVNVVASAVGASPDQGRKVDSPLGLLDPPTNVPPAALFLTSRGAASITGTILVVDGGRTASV